MLPGVTRARVMAWVEDEPSWAFERRMLSVDDVLDADEVFVTNSSWGVLPVVRVERETIGGGGVGPVAREMRGRWLAEFSS